MDRRSFVLRLPMVTAGVSVSTLALGACGGPAWVRPRRAGERLLVAADAVPEGSGIFVENPAGDRPVFLQRRGDGFLALEARCTHRGCQPEPVADRLVCPCHGSEFSLDGDVLEGPAEAPLRRLQVQRAGDDVVIWPGRGTP